MGVIFGMQAVRPTPDGGVEPIPGCERFSAPAYEMNSLLQPIADRKNRRAPFVSVFPWYDRAPESPLRASECFKPKEVLESLQGIERELARNAAKYPSSWLFWKSEENGERRAHAELSVVYRGRNCRLFSDRQGVWAVETDPGPREGVHHDLKNESAVNVRVSADGADISVALERVTLLTQKQTLINRMKAVCLRALQDGGLVLAWAG